MALATVVVARGRFTPNSRRQSAAVVFGKSHEFRPYALLSSPPSVVFRRSATGGRFPYSVAPSIPSHAMLHSIPVSLSDSLYFSTQGLNNFRVRTKTPKETKYTAILYDAWRFQKCDFQQNPTTSKFYSKISQLKNSLVLKFGCC